MVGELVLIIIIMAVAMPYYFRWLEHKEDMERHRSHPWNRDEKDD